MGVMGGGELVYLERNTLFVEINSFFFDSRIYFFYFYFSDVKKTNRQEGTHRYGAAQIFLSSSPFL